MPESISSPFVAEFAVALRAVVAAGRVVRDFYNAASAATYAKGDGSPVTDADLASDRVIREHLAAAYPTDAVLTEEGVDDHNRLRSARCWIADPIDGTDQFIRHTDDFDVLLALVVDARPVVAASCNPATGEICAAVAGGGAWTATGFDTPLRPARIAPAPDSAARLATSVWFGAPDNAPLVARINAHLSAAPTAILSTGFSPRTFTGSNAIDAYVGIRRGTEQAMGWEWDFAAADLFIREAGGMVTGIDGTPFRYNQPDPRCRRGLAAARDLATHQRLVHAIARSQETDR